MVLEGGGEGVAGGADVCGDGFGGFGEGDEAGADLLGQSF